MPGIVLGLGIQQQTKQRFAFMELTFWWGKPSNQQSTNKVSDGDLCYGEEKENQRIEDDGCEGGVGGLILDEII